MKHIFKYIFIIVFFGLTGIKCKSPDRNISLPEPNPASAEITLDTVSSITETIGPDGGKIEVVGTDGVNYLFTIPKGFLISEIEVTMTSITSLTSPMLDKFTAGVHFEPDGLMFPGVAWLEISGGVLDDKLVDITYEGKGDEVARSWAELDGSTIRIPITHFSGAGAGTPAPGAGDRSPTNSYRAMSNALMAAYIDGGGKDCIRKDHPLGEIVEMWYKSMFDAKVEPLLEASVTNDIYLAEGIRAFLEWKEWPWTNTTYCNWEELRDEEPESDIGEKLIKAGLENAIDMAADYCAKDHDIGETNHILKWMANYMQLFGVDDENMNNI